MIIKFFGLGFKGYFQDKFNTFDCVIVMISTIDILVTYGLPSSDDSGGSSAISALRAFRLLRVFKIAKSWKKLQDLLKTIGKTLKDVSNFSVLLFLFMFTYTLLGMDLFAYKVAFDDEGNLDIENGSYPDSNFNYFLEAFASVFIILANDGWSTIYFNHYRAGFEAASVIYFVSFLVIGQLILVA